MQVCILFPISDMQNLQIKSDSDSVHVNYVTFTFLLTYSCFFKLWQLAKRDMQRRHQTVKLTK